MFEVFNVPDLHLFHNFFFLEELQLLLHFDFKGLFDDGALNEGIFQTV